MVVLLGKISSKRAFLDTFGYFQVALAAAFVFTDQEEFTLCPARVNQQHSVLPLWFRYSAHVRSVLVSGRSADIITNFSLVSDVASLVSSVARDHLSLDREPNSLLPNDWWPSCEYLHALCFVLRILVPIRPVLYRKTHENEETNKLHDTQLKFLIIITFRLELTYLEDTNVAILLSFRPTQLSSLKPGRETFFKANLN